MLSQRIRKCFFKILGTSVINSPLSPFSLVNITNVIADLLRLSPGISLLGGKLDYDGLTTRCDLHIEPCTSSHATMVVHRGGVHSPFHAGDHVLTTLIKVY